MIQSIPIYIGRVGGSNPSTPTTSLLEGFFYLCTVTFIYCFPDAKTKNRYYIGATCDELKERVRRHNSHHKKGFTGTVNDWELVYSEDFKSKEEAFSREREVKKWKSRKKIETLISST
ncbi:GIY-YIG nuclease family protein [Cyclobacterium marinum]|uniref:Excinuclease ABC C subunit domain protein n=1 Tax=Cyclobacterium marinum (strain ATCC 25205 / DSM 745 / LMG 13164 / NCIMB 1802) TaxID=880070 RepID=G0IUW8_CYCMS|nr:GIY-YIG nuclease family protein [Cyclobacterium marinum]AEL26192.1 Excinuclease ABC C subunit domain protein [Cyclobacterium marinum DSM 745]